MNLNRIKELFVANKEVHFKLFSLDYTIKQIDNNVVIIYADIYSSRPSKYNTIDELLNNYTIYNEKLIDNGNRIINIKW